jgi:hypothetical protein
LIHIVQSTIYHHLPRQPKKHVARTRKAVGFLRERGSCKRPEGQAVRQPPRGQAWPNYHHFHGQISGSRQILSSESFKPVAPGLHYHTLKFLLRAEVTMAVVFFLRNKKSRSFRQLINRSGSFILENKFKNFVSELLAMFTFFETIFVGKYRGIFLRWALALLFNHTRYY